MTSDPAPDDDNVLEDVRARARARRTLARDDDPVPRLPRGRGIKLSRGQLFKILMTATLLVLLFVFQQPCSEGVSRFVTDFDTPTRSTPEPGSGAVKPASETGDYELIGPNMTDAERDAAIQRALAKGAAKTGSGAPR